MCCVEGVSNLITAANFCQNGKFAVAGTYDGRCLFYDTEVSVMGCATKWTEQLCTIVVVLFSCVFGCVSSCVSGWVSGCVSSCLSSCVSGCVSGCLSSCLSRCLFIDFFLFIC